MAPELDAPIPAGGGVAGLVTMAVEIVVTTVETVVGVGGEPAGTPLSLVSSVFGLVTWQLAADYGRYLYRLIASRYLGPS